MKKDYIPVDELQYLLDDASFLGRYWGKVWKEKGNIFTNSEVPNLEKDEKYKIMSPYMLKLPLGSKILDGGCGIGKWTVFLHARGYESVGVDVSGEAIGKSKKIFPDINFIQGDIRKLGFKDGCFDAYLSWGAFEHFEEGLGPCLKEANRVLRHNGYLFITIPFHNRWHLKRDSKPLRVWDKNYDRQKGYASKMRFYQWRLTKPELQREMEIYGFRTLKIRPIHKKLGFRYLLKQDFGIKPGSIFYRLARLFYPFVSADCVAHMLMCIGQKHRTL